MDLYVFDSFFDQVGGSGGGTSHETVDLVLPTDTTYYVLIHGYDTVGPDSPYVLYDWSVPLTPGGSLGITSSPASAVGATVGTVSLAWSGIGTSPEMIGAVVHTGPGGVLKITGVEINVAE